MNTTARVTDEREEDARAKETKSSVPVRTPLESVLSLQRTAGNAAVARMLARRAAVRDPDPGAEAAVAEPDEPDEFEEAEETEDETAEVETSATPTLAKATLARNNTKTKAPPALKLKSTTKIKAPTGGRKRTDVGVGEEVTFTSNLKGAWASSGGTALVPVANGKKFKWRASDRAGAITITVTAGTQTATTTMNVIEPNAITAKKVSEVSYPKGVAGAGMKLRFVINPLNVSFGNIEFKEVSGPPTNVTGYYTALDPATDLWHDSGDNFYPVGKDNKDTATDTARESADPPYTDGTYDWVIPNKFKTIHEGGDGKQFTTTTHAVQLEGPPHAGRITLSKAGQTVRRAP